MLATIVYWLGLIFGIWSGLVVLYRFYKRCQWAWDYGNVLPPPRRYMYELPLVITIICWVVVIVIAHDR